MSKFLKFLIVVQLLLGIAAVTLGTLLFLKREELKGRTLVLENSIKDIAATTEHLAELDEEMMATNFFSVSPADLRTFYRLDPATGKPAKDANKKRYTSGPGTMQDHLDDLVSDARIQYENLELTRSDLRNAVTDLGEEQDDHERTKGKLENTREERDKLSLDLEDAEKVIAELRAKIDTQEQEKRGLQGEINDRERKIAQLEEEKQAVVKEQIATQRALDQALFKLDDRNRSHDTLPGSKGRIILVNTKWNFVVIKIPEDSDLNASVELLVHRADSFVGKLRVTSVTSGFAVAEILNEWQQLPIQEGDAVLFH